MELVPPMAMWSSVWTEDGEESVVMDGTSITPKLLADKEVLILKVATSYVALTL